MRLYSFDVGVRNLAYCVLDVATRELVAWRVLDLGPKIVADELPHRVKDAMSNLTPVPSSEDVAIVERQPNRCGRNCRVEAYITMSFVMMGLDRVLLFWPHEKLAKGLVPAGKANYRLRKQESVSQAAKWIEGNGLQGSDMGSMFAKAKKKDDLSDCLIQAIAYLDRRPCFRQARHKTVVRSRKPTAKQIASGRYTKCSIRYMLERKVGKVKVRSCDVASLRKAASSDPNLQKSIRRVFGSYDECFSQLGFGRSTPRHSTDHEDTDAVLL